MRNVELLSSLRSRRFILHARAPPPPPAQPSCARLPFSLALWPTTWRAGAFVRVAKVGSNPISGFNVSPSLSLATVCLFGRLIKLKTSFWRPVAGAVSQWWWNIITEFCRSYTPQTSERSYKRSTGGRQRDRQTQAAAARWAGRWLDSSLC